jgi:hypothetical protein
MRIDSYTKAVLTAIVVFLAVIAFRPYVSPDSVAHAQGTFAGVQFAYQGGPMFFDSRSGDVLLYSPRGVAGHYRLVKLGAPMVEVK